MFCVTEILHVSVIWWYTEASALKIIGGSWAYIHRFMNSKRKFYNCNANIFFNQECLRLAFLSKGEICILIQFSIFFISVIKRKT
jgi:hypothetical protein